MRGIGKLLGLIVSGNGLGCLDKNSFETEPASRKNFDPEKLEGFFRIIRSDSYSGRLVIFLESPEALQKVQQKFPELKFTRSPLRDSVFYADVHNQEAAQEWITELAATPEVRLVYPKQKHYGPHAEGTPNLEGAQTYLEGAERAGLNIFPAWNEGVYGAGVMAGVYEDGLNFENEEFELSQEWVMPGGNSWGMPCRPETVDDSTPISDCLSRLVAHGTATTGIIHARHGNEEDRHGIRGIAPEAWTTIGSPRSHQMPNGSIYIFECADQFSWDGRVTCRENHSGLACVPCTADPETYGWIQEIASLRDVSVLMTAGNGAIPLDEVELIDNETKEIVCRELSEEEPPIICNEEKEAVLIGASKGDREMANGMPQKQEYSNCGSEVQFFGWGERVVTTTWWSAGEEPDLGYRWEANGDNANPPNDDPNRMYTNQFGGTSAAAAMVAGAAVLVQSYFKSIAGGNSFPMIFGVQDRATSGRYLTPKKLKEILYNSGIEAVANDGCQIGRQPRMDEALRLTQDFWNQILADYPELNIPEISEERLAQLREEGVGLQCIPRRESGSDISCPDSIMWPPIPCDRDSPEGSPIQCITEDILPHVSKKMDFDEDGQGPFNEGNPRGDLVSWEPGLWRMDLSSYPPGGGDLPEPNDKYGAWDVELNYPPISRWEIPVVEDYDSDGRADLAIYDRENGRWNIAITNEETLQGIWHGWDHVVNWPARGDSQRWEDEFYTRPLPADYNGDKWMDLAVQTSDGHWKINFGWRDAAAWEAVGRRFVEYGPLIPDYENNAVGQWTSPGVWDLAYLTEEELREYPGWAYIPALFGFGAPGLWYRGPEGFIVTNNSEGTFRYNFQDYGIPPFSGTEDIPVTGNFNDIDADEFVVKSYDGFWKYYRDGVFAAPEPNGVFGGGECKPVVLDLDGDAYDDRAVQCPSEWRIIYSGNIFSSQADANGVRHISLSYGNPSSMPGQPAFGGLAYQRVEQIRNFIQALGLNGAPPLVDYSMIPYEYCDLPWLVEEMPPECF